MAIFVVLGLGNSKPAMAEAVSTHFPGDFYAIESDKWLVRAEGFTAKGVSDKLGVLPDSNLVAITFTVSGYFGLAPSDLWEWIAAKSSLVKVGG